MEYTFVLKDKGTANQGWWLKITKLSELEDYIGKVQSKVIARGLFNYLEYKGGREHLNELGNTMVMLAKNNNTDVYSSALSLQSSVIRAQVNALSCGEVIYINSAGGWHAGGEYSDFVHKDKPVFPDFTDDSIRVKKFDGGKHYYAYVGNIQVRDGDVLKWNTFNEAYKQALKYVNGD